MGSNCLKMHDSCSFHVALHCLAQEKISSSTKCPIPTHISNITSSKNQFKKLCIYSKINKLLKILLHYDKWSKVEKSIFSFKSFPTHRTCFKVAERCYTAISHAQSNPKKAFFENSFIELNFLVAI